MRNEYPIHNVQNMTSVDEFEPPLPSLAPALAAPDIKPSLEGTSCYCINPLQHPAGDQPALASCRRCRFPSHAPRFSDHPPVGTGHQAPPLPETNVPPFLQPGKGWPPCRPAAWWTKQTDRQGGSRSQASAKLCPGGILVGPSRPGPPLTSLSLDLLDFLGHTHRDPAAEIGDCLADA